jgi:hypothetical protein
VPVALEMLAMYSTMMKLLALPTVVLMTQIQALAIPVAVETFVTITTTTKPIVLPTVVLMM